VVCAASAANSPTRSNGSLLTNISSICRRLAALSAAHGYEATREAPHPPTEKSDFIYAPSRKCRVFFIPVAMRQRGRSLWARPEAATASPPRWDAKSDWPLKGA
jgi:hypothetical protein